MAPVATNSIGVPTVPHSMNVAWNDGHRDVTSYAPRGDGRPRILGSRRFVVGHVSGTRCLQEMHDGRTADRSPFASASLESAHWMTAVAIASRSLLLAATLVVTSCASGPSLARAVTVETGQATRVSLMQRTRTTTLLLQNASSVEKAQFYGGSNAQNLGKVVADDRLQALLDVFAEKGMFANAAATAPHDARDVLVVEQGSTRWVWSRRLAGTQASEVAFHEAKGYFLEVYNSATAYHGASGDGVPQLGNEKSVLREGKMEHVERRKP